jgi:hypothetical protein
MGAEVIPSPTSWLAVAAALSIGGLSWSFVEYLIHGILAHRFKTPVSPLHWGHHRTPAAVFTSPIAWVPTGCVIFGLAAWAVGLLLAAAFMAGLLAGFFRYEFVHWRIHFREPRTRRQARLRSHHLAHHFVNPRVYHGVTTRFWDHVFRTLPEGWENDYARAAARPPIQGPSNLRASFSPRATWTVVANAIRRGSPAS